MSANLTIVQHMALSKFRNLYGVVEMSASVPEEIEDGWVVNVRSRNIGEIFEINFSEYIQYVRQSKLKELGI